MIDIKFSDFLYYPSLRTRRAELNGLQRLDNEEKKQIIPLLTLGRWPKSDNLEKSMEHCLDSMGDNPFFVDLTYDQDTLSDKINILRNPNNGFENWREFIKSYNKIIPVIQFNDSAPTRDIIQQALKCEADFGKIAFRIRDYVKDIPRVIAGMSAISNTENAIVFIDSQFIRNSYAPAKMATISTINEIRRNIPNSYIVSLASSFPQSLPGENGVIDIQERSLHMEIGSYNTAFYGDYGSIHAVVYDNPNIMRWSPRIDYPSFFEWIYERRSYTMFSPREGYIDAAQAIVNKYPDIKDEKSWGAKMIIDAANGNPYGNSPVSWIAVRVNIHLSKQINLSKVIFSEEDDDVS